MKRKKIINLLILFVAIILVLYFTLKDDFDNVISELSKVNVWIYLVAIFLFLLSLLFKSFSLRGFINEYHEYGYKNTFNLTLIAHFLNGVTPFQSGGQPFQIYLLKKDGVRISDATNAMIKDFLSFQSALIIVGILALIFNTKLELFSSNKYLVILILIGFIINLIILGLLIFILVAKKSGYKLINKLMNFILKFRFMKKFESKKEKLNDSLKHFYDTGKELKQNKWLFYKGIIYNVISLTILYIIPMIVFISLGSNKVSITESFCATAFVMLIGNFIPIPGATGGIEYSFMQFFGNYVSGSLLSGGMLLWRFATYLFGLIIGAIALLFKKDVKKK